MAIKLTIDGAELTFDTVAEYNEFAKTNEAITEEGVAADELTAQKETYYMAKPELCDTETEKGREFKQAAAKRLFVKEEKGANSLLGALLGKEHSFKCVDSFDGTDGGIMAANDDDVYEVTREEFEQKKAEFNAIKVGDKVEIIGNTDNNHHHDIGDIGVVVNDLGTDVDVRVGDLTQTLIKSDVKKVDSETEEKFNAKHELSADKDGDSAEYERIAFEDAKVGDYWVADEEGVDIKEGNRYLITDVYVDDDGDKVVTFDDDEGDERERVHFSDNGHVERKAAQPDSELVVGAKYRVTGKNLHCFDIGTEVTFTGEYGELSLLPKFKNGLGHVQCLDLWEVERINDEETAQENSDKDMFKEGDRVKAIAGLHEGREGAVQRRADYEGFFVVYDGDHDTSYTYEGNLQKLDENTDKEGFEYDGVSYVYIDRGEVEVGDYIVAKSAELDITADKPYKVIDISFGEVTFYDDEEDDRERFVDDTDYYFVRKAGFKVGDKVRVSASWFHNFADGTEGEIIDEIGEGAFVVKTDDPSQQSVSNFSYGKGVQSIPIECLTLVTDDVESQGTSFEKGDRVVVTEEGDGRRHYFKKGTVGTVIGGRKFSGKIYVQADSNNAWIADSEYADKDDNAQYISERSLETFTSKHIEVGAKYEVVERAERYSSGIYVEKGDIVKVNDVLSDGDIHVENVDGSESGMVILAKEAYKLRKVEDDEVQTQEIDFEKGDIIRMKEEVTDEYGDKVKEGRLAEVKWHPTDTTKIAVIQRKGKPCVIVPKSAVELVAKAIK